MLLFRNGPIKTRQIIGNGANAVMLKRPVLFNAADYSRLLNAAFWMGSPVKGRLDGPYRASLIIKSNAYVKVNQVTTYMAHYWNDSGKLNVMNHQNITVDQQENNFSQSLKLAIPVSIALWVGILSLIF
jgi:hypothetical protein